MPKIISKDSEHFQIVCNALIIVFPAIFRIILHLEDRLDTLVLLLAHQELLVLLQGEIVRPVMCIP